MSIAGGLNRRITQLAVGRHLSQRAVRMRLTLLYGALFLVSGAALMAITYLLLVNAGFVFSLQHGVSAEEATSALPSAGSGARAGLLRAGLLRQGSRTHPSARTLAHWEDVAKCIRSHGVSGFPGPRTSFPSNPTLRPAQIADREGAIFLISAAILQSAAFPRAAEACAFSPDRGDETPQARHRRAQARQELLIQAGIALAGMSLISLLLGWLMAGRVLQPLEDAYDAQRQFVANASHELRAPLTRQRALIQVALSDPDASFASLRATHERVLASERHLEQTIDGLLTLTRGQAGLERRERIDLATLASDVLRAREAEIADAGLDLRATLAAAPTTGDPRLTERLIANLVDNAIAHNAPRGHIEVATGSRDRRGFVSITNTGPTIPPEELPRLLRPFERLHGTRTTHAGGHGLGLAIVAAIAAAHQATLTVESRPGGGMIVDAAFPATGRDARQSRGAVPALSAPRRLA